jgi:hypothetical protein
VAAIFDSDTLAASDMFALPAFLAFSDHNTKTEDHWEVVKRRLSVELAASGWPWMVFDYSFP